MKNNRFEIEKTNGLFGTIKNQTSKNATLPILAASLMTDKKVIITDIPNISDVDNMLKILKSLGVGVKKKQNQVEIDPVRAKKTEVAVELCGRMRSSIFLLGSMLSKFKSAKISMPGGCRIGKRPIDLHIKSLQELGVAVKYSENSITFFADKAHAGTIKLKIPSVGATENIIQFACKLKGITTIINPAREPEIIDLCNFLNQMGAKILGAGTKKITICGVNKLCSTLYRPMGDRIVAGTIMTAVALTGGDVTISNAVPYQNEKLIKIMSSMGCQIDYKNDIIHIVKDKNLRTIKRITTGFYPKLATDLQSLLLTLSCVTEGKTRINEIVFENRFQTVSELRKMGAEINPINSNSVEVKGVERLTGTTVIAKELRGGASLVLAGLVAEGKTIVENAHFIDRGYEKIETMLSGLGAKIRRI